MDGTNGIRLDGRVEAQPQAKPVLDGARVREWGKLGKWDLPFEATYQLRGWEKEVAMKEGAAYDVTRAVIEQLPIIRYVYPSARDRFTAMSSGGKTLELFFDAIGILPFLLIGKGARVSAAAKTVGGLLGKPINQLLPFRLPARVLRTNPFADEALKASKFRYEMPEVKIAQKWDLGVNEIKALREGNPYVWKASADGTLVKGWSPKLKPLFTKDAKLRKPVASQLEEWDKSPQVQRVEHTEKLLKEEFRKVTGQSTYTYDELFKSQAVRLYGEAGKDLTWSNVTHNQLSNMLLDTMEQGGKLKKHLDISGWSQTKPVRKVFGSMEAMYGSYSNFYQKVIGHWNRSSKTQALYVQAFHGILAGTETKVGQPLLRVVLKKSGKRILSKNFTPGEFTEAGILAAKADAWQGIGRSAEEIRRLKDAAPEKVRLIAQSLEDWYNYMYKDYAVKSLPMVFEKAGMTKEGTVSIQALMEGPGGFNQILDELLSTGSNLPHQSKLAGLEGVLQSLKKVIPTKENQWQNLRWFTEKPAEKLTKEELGSLKKTFEGLEKELTFRKGKAEIGFPGYLENYTARIPKDSVMFNTSRKTGFPTHVMPGFVRARIAEEGKDVVTDIAKLVVARSGAQAKALEFYPHLDELKEIAKVYPTNLRSYSEHYINRLMGNPSPVDRKVADWLGRTFGGGWDDRRVIRLSRSINDLIYLGGIGFKPFSAARNLLQPLMMVPADMGGIKDFLWLARGYRRALTLETRNYMRSIGAIREFTPDLVFMPKVVGQSGFMQKARDLGMFLFKESDEWNRFVTGGAALEKWDYYFAKYAKGTGLSRTSAKSFAKKLNLNSREAWVRKELNELLEEGSSTALERAKSIWVNDVIADTQYLYGIQDSPLITHTWGSPGRTGLVFQSWWMNYGSTFAKWMTRTPETGGVISDTNKRLFSFMLSSAMAYQAAKQIWGERTAARSVGLGPFPMMPSIPAPMKPFFDATVLLAKAIPVLPPFADLDEIKKQGIATIKSSMIYIPGGIQLGQTLPPLVKGDLPKTFASIIKYHRD